MHIEERNAERRALCAEYAQNAARRKEIIARLAELSGEANKEAAAERIEVEFHSPQALRAMLRQAEVVRREVAL